jgi:hypothetical protein
MNYQYKYYEIKKKYIEEKHNLLIQIGGATYYNPKNKKQYGGAGIILVEKYNNKPAIILFKSTRKSKEVYEGLGGRIDDEQLIHINPLLTTAIREAFEESRGLINIDPYNSNKTFNNYIDISGINNSKKHYRSYFVGVESNTIFIDDYNHNKKKLDNNKQIKNTMKETNGISRFYIKDLIKLNHNDNEDYEVKDSNGNNKLIFGRTVKILKQAFKTPEIFDKALISPLEFIPIKSLLSI